MTREDPQLKIRLPWDLKDALTQKAAENGRSLNAEIVGRMRASFDDGFTDENLLASIKELVVTKKLSDLFGSEVAEGVGLYAQHITGAGRYNEALEELIRWSLIDFGILTPDEGETRPHSPFLSSTRIDSLSEEERQAGDDMLDEMASGGPKL